MGRMVRLTTRAKKLVSSEQDVASAPGKSITVPASVWRKALALARTYSSFIPPRRGAFIGGQVSQFAKALRAALDARPEPSGSPRSRPHLTVRGQFAAFFGVPAHEKALQAILRLVEGGGSLEVMDDNTPAFGGDNRRN